MDGSGDDEPIPGIGGAIPDYPALAPSPDEIAGNDEDDTDAMAPGAPGAPMGQVIMMPPSNVPQPGDQRPPESDEQRAGMPKPAHLVRTGIRQAVVEHFEPVDNSQEDPGRPEHWRPTGKFATPKHVGMRRHVVFEEVDDAN
jgi:hypothetical protein